MLLGGKASQCPDHRADGRYRRILIHLLKQNLLVIDDGGFTPLEDLGHRDLLEILEDRHGRRSTLVASELPIAAWHETIGDKTLADAILDRLVHNSYKIALKEESMRKTTKSLTQSGHEGTKTMPCVASLRQAADILRNRWPR